MILSQLNPTRFVALLICPPDGELQRKARVHNVSCVNVQQLTARFTWKVRTLVRYLLSFVSTIREVRARVRKHEPDLIHANSVRAGLVMSAATLGLRIPIVWHVHDLLLHHPLSTCIRTAVLLHPPTRIVVVANAAAERFKGKLLRPFPRRVRIDVVYNAVAAAELSGNTSSIRKELRLRGNDRLIGLVGNLSPVKGQLELLRAFAKVRQQVPGAALLIVGSTLFNRDDGYQQQLHAEVRSLGLEPHVRFLGQRDDVPAIMSELDLLVLNSRSEAFPLVALEGMTAGVPVLATAVGGLPELIMPAENGLLIPFGDEAKLIEAIQLLLKRPGFSGDLARRAREHVTQNYSVSKFVSSFEAIYTAVVQKPLPAGNERLALSSTTTLTNV